MPNSGRYVPAYLCAALHPVTDDSARHLALSSVRRAPNLAQAVGEHRAKAVRAVLRVVRALKC
jgi:hypothetical protein